MFVLDDKNITYWYPVTVEMTASDGARKQRFSFDAEFERIPQDEINEMFRKRGEDETPLRDAEVLERVLRGWRGIQEVDGTELAVNPENRARLLNQFPVPGSIVKAFLKSIGVEGQRKN